VPNLFPAVTFPAVATGGSVAAATGPPASTSSSPAIGAHEVIIECPRHVDRTSALSVTELGQALEVYAQRLRHWRDDGRLRYGLVFKNQGRRAGASLAHLHSQLVALPAVPSTVEAELHRAAQDFAHQRSCPYCRLICQERSVGERIVFERDGFVAFCPHASLQPFETWLLPVEHQPAFERPTDSGALGRLAGVLHGLIGRVEAIVPEASYNFILRTAPWLAGIDPWSHWRIELLPRVTTFAGLEFATGIHINLLTPEHAAQHLRTV
jgi:UDPglucose--hexose-1-phosphate uridylyltransferase